MPRLKERQRDMADLENRYKKAIECLDNGIYATLGEAATAFGLAKSSLGHRRNGRQDRKAAHQGEQLFSPAAEKAIVRWIVRMDDFGIPPRLDHLWDMLQAMAETERKALRQRLAAEGKRSIVHEKIGKNFITRFLNRHPELVTKFVSRIDRQRSFANNPLIIRQHFRKLRKLLAEHHIKPYAITNVDEKGIILGLSSKMKVITQRAKKRSTVKQHGKREMVTLVEAVTAAGYIFPSLLITKGKIHTYGKFGNVTTEDYHVRFAVSPKGWTDDELGYYWLTEIYDPYSKQQLQHPAETRLLILDGHASHVNYKFCLYCKANNIQLYCLPPHSTHILQPLDVGLFSPLQREYSKAIEDYHNTTGLGINHSTFLPHYKQARKLAYTQENIESAFRATGIVPLNPRSVLKDEHNYPEPPPLSSTFPLDKTPYTKCQLRVQTNRALAFARTGTRGQICEMVIKISHSAEYHLTQTNIVKHQMDRLRKESKVKPAKKDNRVIGRERVLTGAQVLERMKQRDQEAELKASKKRRPRTQKNPAALPCTPKQTKVRFIPPPSLPKAFPQSLSRSSSSSSTSSKDTHSPTFSPLVGRSPLRIGQLAPTHSTPLDSRLLPQPPPQPLSQSRNRRLPDRPLGMSLRKRL